MDPCSHLYVTTYSFGRSLMALDEQKLKVAVAALHEKKRKFSESYDLIVSLKDLNLKDPKEQIEFFAIVPHSLGKKRTVCCLVGPEMVDDAGKIADFTLEQSQFERMQKKDLRKIAAKYDYFVGQANIMPKIAGSFGRVLGPRGKMPNPKAGCIVPPKAPLQPLVERLQKTVKVNAKKSPNVQVLIATQDLKPEQVIENVKSLYDQLIHNLPKEENNVRHVYLKLTMSKPHRLN
jgi:large subunit ribosomal protein L1